SDPSDTDSATTLPNSAPEFPVQMATVSVNENTPTGTSISGAGRTATDADGDAIAYSFVITGGSDYTHFALDPANGQVSTHGTLDHEARASYSVTVRATDTEGASGDIAYTINVADRDEPPDAPATPSVAALPVVDPANPDYRLRVSWSAPPNDGRPPISGYDVQYRRGTSGAWTDGPQDISATETTLTGLEEDAPYQVQVLARNDEGVSLWSSPPGSGRTNSATNTAPVFGQSSVIFTVVENTAADTDIGSPVSATDAEGDAITYSLVGAEAAAFAIDASTGQVRTKDPLDFETKSSYAFQVRAEDDRGASSTASVRVDVTNAVELPAVPNPPLVTATFRSDTSIDVSWTPPANTGPPIDSYDLQWREGTSGSWTDGPQNVSGTSAAIGGLATGTQHQVRVRASNADGDTDWSGPGTGSTNTENNQPPSFSRSSATLSVPENSPGGLAVGSPLTATDPDTADVPTYSLEGADAASFDIEAQTGQIRTRTGADYAYEARARYRAIAKADTARGGPDPIATTIRLPAVR
ncbi:MAG: cadherin domain-containing protein, partial [Chloroflexi bacterium]|nr:cadherin domain-containing protein [Chloroflexota bacterium]